MRKTSSIWTPLHLYPIAFRLIFPVYLVLHFTWVSTFLRPLVGDGFCGSLPKTESFQYNSILIYNFGAFFHWFCAGHTAALTAPSPCDYVDDLSFAHPCDLSHPFYFAGRLRPIAFIGIVRQSHCCSPRPLPPNEERRDATEPRQGSTGTSTARGSRCSQAGN